MLRNRIRSFRYAFQGLCDVARTQPNFRIHIIAACLATLLGFLLHLAYAEWCLLVLTITLVLAAESLNTAIEYLTDLVSPNHHPLAGKAKDAAAAAVLMTSIAAVIIGLLLFIPKIYVLL
ncbi:MAG: diacylglycerol kinase family protein [Saprospiraceae bacterium]|nr:diacylglycerol kinase family protein [Saprospiraceae bacterium]MBP7680120.1 diacylglycerol kinase family protein [Saprospiraceae bacterium]